MFTRIFKRHDTTPARVRLLSADGTIRDLTGATGTYTLTEISTNTIKVNRGTIVVMNQTTNPGEAYYPYTSGNVDTAGVYTEEWEIVYPDGTKETFPAGDIVIVRIEADADNT
jgi:hypothetical protein